MEIMQEKTYTDGNFSERLSGLISKCGETQREISIQTGISPSALAKYKTDRIPKSEELFKLSQFFGISMEELLTGKKLSSAESMALAVNMFDAENNPNATGDPTEITPEQVKRMEELEEVLDENGELDMAKYWKRDAERQAAKRGDAVKLESPTARDLELENAVLKGQLEESRRAYDKLVDSLDVGGQNGELAMSSQDRGENVG